MELTRLRELKNIIVTEGNHYEVTVTAGQQVSNLIISNACTPGTGAASGRYIIR